MTARSVARGAALGAALAWAAPALTVLVASCGSSGGGAAPDGGVPTDAAKDTTTDGLSAPDGADGAGPDAPRCPVRDGLRAACDGSDPRLVFFPPLACDPKTLDAGAAADASSDAGDAGDAAAADPCGAVGPYDVSFTGAACAAFVDAQLEGAGASPAPGRAPLWTEPSDGAMLTADAWSVFAWAKGTQARRSPLATFLEPEAHALTPLGGDGYVITFSQGCTEVLRAHVATTFWAPDPESWATLSSLQGPVTVRVYWAKFAQDKIVSGPYGSLPITITMTK